MAKKKVVITLTENENTVTFDMEFKPAVKPGDDLTHLTASGFKIMEYIKSGRLQEDLEAEE